LFELKAAERVLVEGCRFSQHWVDDQSGPAIVFTPRNQNGGFPEAVVRDVAFVSNVIHDVSGGVNLLGRENIKDIDPDTGEVLGVRHSELTERILIHNNLWYAIGGDLWGGYGRIFQLLNGGRDIAITRNTVVAPESQYLAMFDEAPVEGLVFSDNIATLGAYGIRGSETTTARATFDRWAPGAEVGGNVFVGGRAPADMAGNTFVASVGEVGFADADRGVFQLRAPSPYTGRGVDFAALESARSRPAPAPPPPEPPPPVEPEPPLPPPPVTGPAPKLSAFAVRSLGEREVTVSWDTNVPASTEIEYGLADDRLVIDMFNTGRQLDRYHPVTLRGLEPGTEYVWVAISRDAAGTVARSEPQTFTTLGTAPKPEPPPVTPPPPDPEPVDEREVVVTLTIRVTTGEVTVKATGGTVAVEEGA
jgi:hypothetical protein